MDMVFRGGCKPHVNLHGTTRTPVGLWQLNGSLVDASGNGYDLTCPAGTANYVPFIPGDTTLGLYCDGVCYLYRNSRTAAFDLVGNMTMECLVRFLAPPATLSSILAYQAAGETQAANSLWDLRLLVTTPSPHLGCLEEYGSGTDTTAYSTKPVTCDLHHIAVVRSGLDHIFYVDGVAVETVAAPHAPDTSGSPVEIVYLCAAAGGENLLADAILGSVAIIGSALTGPQVLADAQGCLPWLA